MRARERLSRAARGTRSEESHALSSPQWVAAFNEIKADGSSTNPNTTETGTARFWTANVIRQYNALARDVATAKSLDLVRSARLFAMVNTVGADAQISVMYAKYHYLFWRPVTAIDPTSVTNDGFGSAPGYNDGNAVTVEQAGWRPLIATPNHPEYPAAHGSITGAMSVVFSTLLGTDANQGMYLFLEALGRYRYDGDSNSSQPRVWELVPGLHWRMSDSVWMSGGVLVPLRASGMSSGLSSHPQTCATQLPGCSSSRSGREYRAD